VAQSHRGVKSVAGACSIALKRVRRSRWIEYLNKAAEAFAALKLMNSSAFKCLNKGARGN